MIVAKFARLLPALTVACAALAGMPAVAQTSGGAAPGAYPSKALRWIVPYPAGGGSDFLARNIGQVLATHVGQPVVVDNKPGANTALAAVETARAPADGYTMLSADNGTLIFNPVLYKSLSYDPVRDLAPVTLMGRFPMILVVGADAPVKNLAEFVALAKARPGSVNFASAGAGSPHHLAMELFKVNAGLFMVHVPYRGAAPALADVAGGQVPAMMVDLAAGAGFIKAGKVRALAVANGTRLAQLPDVPTFAEAGFKGVEAAALVGLVVPKATPAATIDSLNRQVVAALLDPAVNKKLVDFGIEPVGSTPAEFTTLLQRESVRWHKLIRDQKISLD